MIASEDAFFAVAEVEWGAHVADLSATNRRDGRSSPAQVCCDSRASVHRAKEIGFVHEVCPVGGLDAALAAIVDSIMLNGPKAVRRSKGLALEISGLA